MDLFDLEGKAALVTGGNGGIGLGMAQALAEAGADVAIWGTNPAKNEIAAQQLRATGRRVVATVCDVSSEEQVIAAFAAAVYLADPRIEFHTGDMLVVDGGYTIF